MSPHKLARLAGLALAALLILSVIAAATASNAVPATRLDSDNQAITLADLRPSECSALALTVPLACPSGGGNCTGTNAAELILGSPNSDTIRGGGGNDCILGGGSLDLIYGDGGTDVCLGGPGTDFFLPLFTPSCETRIQ